MQAEAVVWQHNIPLEGSVSSGEEESIHLF